METLVKSVASTNELQNQIEGACALACQSIAPAWPLDRAIAVNPHWSRVGMPVRQVAARMAVLGGIRVFPLLDSQHQAWQEGRISLADLALALQRVPYSQLPGLTAEQCVDALRSAPQVPQLPLLIDVLDNDSSHQAQLSWRQVVTHQASQTSGVL